MVTQLMGATAVKVPLTDGLVHDLDAMLAAITADTRLLFLCNPNNPTGTIYTRDAFERFIDEGARARARRHRRGVLRVRDER